MVITIDNENKKKNVNIEFFTNFKIHDENNYNEQKFQLDEINKLSFKIDNLFDNNNQNIFSNRIEFNYNFKKEFQNGPIEYKRTLSSYEMSKKDKLIRQIYWRIYEGLITNNINTCYYIIGLEDSGIPSNISEEEIKKSIKIICDTIQNIDLKFTYLYFTNSEQNYNFVIVKFQSEVIDYF